MSLRILSLAVLASLSVLAAGVFYWLYASRFVPAFADVEHDIYIQDSRFMEVLFRLRRESMLARLRGVAKWGMDANYLALARERRAEYETERLDPAPPPAESFDTILLLDGDGAIRYGRRRNPETGAVEPVSADLNRWLRNEAAPLFAYPAGEVSGFVSLYGEPGLVAAAPVRSGSEGRIVGRLVGYDRLSDTLLERMGFAGDSRVELLFVNADPRIAKWARRLDPKGFAMFPDDAGHYTTVFIPKGLTGDREFCVRLVRDREFRDAFFRLFRDIAIMSTAIFVFFAGLIFLFMETTVSIPARRLALATIRLQKPAGDRMPVPEGRVEPLRGVIAAVNRLGAGLNRAERERLSAIETVRDARKLLELIEGAIDISVSGEANALTMVQEKIASFFGLDLVYCYATLKTGMVRTAGVCKKLKGRATNKVDLCGDKPEWVGRLMTAAAPRHLSLDGDFPEGYETVLFMMREYGLNEALCLPLAAGGGKRSGLLLVGAAAPSEYLRSPRETRILSLLGSLMLGLAAERERGEAEATG